MKIFVIIAVIGLIVYGCLNYSTLFGNFGSNTNPAGAVVDTDTFEGKTLEPYALPAGHCKAQFPGKAHIPDPGHALLASADYQSESAMLSDRKVSYFLSELKAPYMEDKNAAPAATPGAPVDDKKAQENLDKTIEYWAKANDVTIKDRRHIGHPSGRYSGMEVTGFIKDASNTVIARFFGDQPNKRVYAIAAAGDATQANTEGSGKFLDSIEIW
jgi:hypothetical protein